MVSVAVLISHLVLIFRVLLAPVEAIVVVGGRLWHHLALTYRVLDERLLLLLLKLSLLILLTMRLLAVFLAALAVRTERSRRTFLRLIGLLG